MVDPDGQMLWELENAIGRARRKVAPSALTRDDVTAELRLQHWLVVGVRDFHAAWAIKQVLHMIDDSPTVNDVLRELRALQPQTPHSNRGVGYVSPMSFSSDEGNAHER